MKNLLRYFVSVIFIVIAFISGTSKSDASALEHQIDDFTSEVTSYYVDSSTSDFDLDLPQQISYANILRLQNTTKRTNNAYKNHFEFIKAGKISHTGIRYSILKATFNIPFSSIKTAHRLIRLGKLII